MLACGVWASVREERGAGAGTVVAGLGCWAGWCGHDMASAACWAYGRVSPQGGGHVSLGWLRPMAREGAGRSVDQKGGRGENEPKGLFHFLIPFSFS